MRPRRACARTRSPPSCSRAAVGWRDVPATYVICERDHAIPVAAQEAMAARAGTTQRLDSDHSPFLNGSRRRRRSDPRRGAVAGAPAS